MPKNNNFDRRGGTPNSGLRGLVKDDVARKDQRVMRGNAALIASLKPAMTAKALEAARTRVALMEAQVKEEALRKAAEALTDLIPDYSARDAVRTRDVDVLAGKPNPRRPWEPVARFVLKWADHGTFWNECEMDDEDLPAVEVAIEAWEEFRAAQAITYLIQKKVWFEEEHGA